MHFRGSSDISGNPIWGTLEIRQLSIPSVKKILDECLKLITSIEEAPTLLSSSVSVELNKVILFLKTVRKEFSCIPWLSKNQKIKCGIS